LNASSSLNLTSSSSSSAHQQQGPLGSFLTSDSGSESTDESRDTVGNAPLDARRMSMSTSKSTRLGTTGASAPTGVTFYDRWVKSRSLMSISTCLTLPLITLGFFNHNLPCICY
jgi:hypothetical protein